MSFLKKTLICGAIAAILYVLLSYHFIFFGWTSVETLKKSKLTLEYTVYSAVGKGNALILSRKELREDGIADLLVEIGRMSEKERDRLMKRYEEEEGEEEN